MSPRLHVLLTTLAVVFAGAGLVVGWNRAHAAVRAAEAEVLRAEAATAARVLREPGGAERLRVQLGRRWRVSSRIDPQLDEAEVTWTGTARQGRAAVYDVEGWDVVGQVVVDEDLAARTGLPARAVPVSGFALLALGALAAAVIAWAARGGAGASVRAPALTWSACALALLAAPTALVERWADQGLHAMTDRRVALASNVLRRHGDVEALAARPSAIVDLTGLRFVPLTAPGGGETLLAASGFPPDVARGLAAAPTTSNRVERAGPSRRVEFDRVEYAVADIGAARLVFLPFEHTHAPTTALVASVIIGVLLGIPLLVLSAAASSARGPRRELVAWSFLLPALVHLAVFTVGPLLFAAWLSLHRWSLVDAARPFVGLQNYVALGSHAAFWRAIGNTAVFTLHVPVSMAVALGLALLVRRPGAASVFARAAFFLPSITSLVAVAMVWQWMLHDEYGLVNGALAAVGLPRVRWLSSPAVALVSVMIVATWTTVGFQTVLFQAGLTAIPRHLYDAARIDGAGRWGQFVHVTLPGLRPTMVFVLVTSVIGSFQVFGTVYVMTEGGPLHATDVAVFHIYEEAWELQRVGSAAAMSWTLFALIFVVTWLQFRTIERRADGGEP